MANHPPPFWRPLSACCLVLCLPRSLELREQQHDGYHTLIMVYCTHRVDSPLYRERSHKTDKEGRRSENMSKETKKQQKVVSSRMVLPSFLRGERIFTVQHIFPERGQVLNSSVQCSASQAVIAPLFEPNWHFGIFPFRASCILLVD